MQRLVKNIGWLLSGRGLNAVLSLVYLALATRALGLDGFGVFAIIIALGQTVIGVATFQTWQFVVRWGAGSDGPADATGFAIALDIISIVFGTVLTAVVIAAAQLWLPLPDDLLPLTFAYCIISLVAIRSTPTGLLRLRFKYALATAADAVQPIVRATGAILAFFFMPTVTGFVLAWAASEIAVALAYWIIAARQEPIDFTRISLKHIPQSHKGVWRFVVATNLSGSLSVGGKQVVVLLVGAIGGEALAGGFRVASQLGQALVQLAQTVSKAIYPELVHAQEAAHDMARRTAHIALIGGTLAVAIAMLLGRWGLDAIAGQAFGIVYWAMVILAISGAIEMVGASLESLLVSAGRAGTAFVMRAVPTLFAFLILPAALGWNGLNGAAFAVLGASALSVAGFWAATRYMQDTPRCRDAGEPKPRALD